MAAKLWRRIAGMTEDEAKEKLIRNLKFQIEGRTSKEPAERPSCFRVNRRSEKNDAADAV
jgi:hypothetical protein